MRYVWLTNLMLCAVLNVTSPQGALAKGTLLDADPVYCVKIIPQKVTFSPAPPAYSFTGTCDLAHTRLYLPIQVPYTAVGTYDPTTGNTTEDINVPAPAINQPSRPYGRFFTSMRCPADPWRTRQVLCDQVVASVNPPGSAYPPRPNPSGDFSRSLIASIIDMIQSQRRPYTSLLADDQWKAFNAQYDLAFAAEKKSQQLQQGAKQSTGASGAYSALLHPSVLLPRPGQIVVSQTPVPIRLAPPNGWIVTGYMINIQRRDAKGNWIAHTTIPVNAADAQSTTGYKGFGNGAPPAFLVTPGMWRLNAQASAPNKSGVSEWVEFNVTASQNIYQDAVQQKNRSPFLKP